MRLLGNADYFEDILYTANLKISWDKLQNKSVLLSGATGMIGSFLIDVIMYKNNCHNFQCTVYLLGRSEEKAKKRFQEYWNDKYFHFIECDINRPEAVEYVQCRCKIEYIIHMASNTHPVAYSTDPVGTVLTNVQGTNNLLQLAVMQRECRFVFCSSVEVYGENRGDVEYFSENYCGYIDSNTVRAGYPESKRTGEALCQAYRKQYGLDVVIPRLPRTYGPTLLKDDSKALSQFLKNGVEHSDIVLKSEGTQLYSYAYVADAVSGLLLCMFCGAGGEAYNVADYRSNVSLRELAEYIAAYAGTNLIFQKPNDIESAGYSKATKALMDGSKLQKLGWNAGYTIKQGVERTLKIMEAMR